MSENRYNTPLACGIANAYKNGEDDEILEPSILADPNHQNPIGRIKYNDGLIFANIRGEREIELTQALIEENFTHFLVKPLNLYVSTMIQYHPNLSVDVAFPPIGKISNNLTEFVSRHNKRVLKCVESEKAIHLTYFFNGKQHEQYENEERIIIPSIETENLANYPEMRAYDVAQTTINKMNEGNHELIITNLSPCDVMGHIEDEQVIKKAIQTVDEQLHRIVSSALITDYTVLVTADHGLAESWLYPGGAIDTGHTSNPVPFLIISHKKNQIKLREGGSLIDIGPTILEILEMNKPSEMEGESLISGESVLKSQRILLLILDGWGYNPDSWGNLYKEFGTPNMDRLKLNYPFTTLVASGTRLGMPEGTVGNSEIGHLHMGVGRRIISDRVKIFDAIENDDFFRNSAFLNAINYVKKNNSALHLLSIISFFSSHGSIKFLESLMELSVQSNLPQVYIHGLLGRRGEKPEAGAYYVNKLEQRAKELGTTKFVSVIGRHWALDREENWDRIQKTYNMLVNGQGRFIPDF
ncbi:MAG: phosphoglycerate mutase (2,3-diphosphoglycerate-independent) [Candidatus Hermodarchaeota archaeon]